jgi:hypothetical protein
VSTSVEVGSLVIGIEDAERFRSGVSFWKGVSGGDNIVKSCCSDSGESWTSSALR